MHMQPKESSDWHLITPNNTKNTSMGMHSSPPSTPLVGSFCDPPWDPPINGHILSYCAVNPGNEASTSSPSMFNSNFPSRVHSSLPDLPEDPGFIERAARFSCFTGAGFSHTANPFSESRIENFMRSCDELNNGFDLSSTRAEVSGKGQVEFSGKGVGLKKRRTVEQKIVNDERNEAVQPAMETNEVKQKCVEKDPISAENWGGKGPAPPEEEYIHVRARRGQATNSHSLAERIRREKISERMKFLQDLVPGCSKVTGKAVMLDEIINYVQSLQRQVEFLSMKLATVNPSLDFDIEGFLAKEPRVGLSPSLDFPLDMISSFPPIHRPQTQLLRPTMPHRPIVSGGFREPTSQRMQASGMWDDELRDVVHNGLDSNARLHRADLIGHAKVEP